MERREHDRGSGGRDHVGGVDAIDAEAVPGLIVYSFDAPLFFANAEVFRNEIRELVRRARHPIQEVVVSAESITDMDVTGNEMIGRLVDLHDAGVRFSMARVRTSLQVTLRSLGLERRIGRENFFLTVVDAARGFRVDAPQGQDADGGAGGDEVPLIEE